MRHVFISDLHLAEETPHLNQTFDWFLKNILEDKDKLYILGDFFNFWIGQDCISDFHTKIFSALTALKTRGISTYFMVGNRDFLIEDELLEKFELIPLKDPYCVSIDNHNLLLSHGDSWCTDNISYQRFRRIVRSPFTIRLFRMLPKSIRRKIAEKLRAQSKQKKYDTLEDICNPKSTANIIIHGHTHNPILELHFNDRHEISYRRIALADWGKQGNAYIINNGIGIFKYF